MLSFSLQKYPISPSPSLSLYIVLEALTYEGRNNVLKTLFWWVFLLKIVMLYLFFCSFLFFFKFTYDVRLAHGASWKVGHYNNLLSLFIIITKVSSSNDNRTRYHLHPNRFCARVMIPDATNNVPRISLLPTLSSAMQTAGPKIMGMVRLAKNIDTKCWNAWQNEIMRL